MENSNDDDEEEYTTEEIKDITAANCPKKSFHSDYIDIKEFALKHIPSGPFRTVDVHYCVLLMAQLTVLIRAPHPKGTGFVQRVRRKTGCPCPCGDCRKNGQGGVSEWGVVTVSTVFHVIQNQEDAGKSTALLYNDGEGYSKKKIHGYRLLETDKDVGQNDWCAVEYVTHEKIVLDRLENDLREFEDLQGLLYSKYKRVVKDNLVVVVGHPHGRCKKVSVGTYVRRETLKDVRDRQNWCRYLYKGALTCEGSSGSPLLIPGQPICGFGYWFGHAHNHSKTVTLKSSHPTAGDLKSLSSVGVDHLLSQRV
ncbi:uncharacterized protein LOC131956809 [Physella acuta]|uniref:uncharacterized protein LOC131956809 n=1 Tax=Physella acuta TaxID=109671 RepID=UPI0027DABF5B|nr:uncharacterized protein LOC131956809 [Physella acuta]